MFPIPSFPNLDRSKLRAVFPQVGDLFSAFAEKHPVPGIAYGIVMDGELVYAGGVGVQNVSSQLPVTPNSVFRIASMTKSFTAMALVKLRDEGKLQFDDLAEYYVPELATLIYPTRDSARITVRQLLTMTAGFPQDDPWADRQLAAGEDELSAWLRKGITFSNPPGVKFEYSNYGYAILGRIVGQVSGMSYQQYVTEHILKPLGMTSTTFDVNTVDPQRLAMGYRYQDKLWVEEPPLADGAFASIGGLFTTITDFATYMNYLLAAFPARDDAESGPVRRSSLREMMQGARQRIVMSSRTTPDAPTWFVSDGYGYGLACGVDSMLGYSVSHGGGLPGYGTYYRLLPDCNIGMVAFSNVTYSAISLKVIDAFAILHHSGGLIQRSVPPSGWLLSAQQNMTDLYDVWSDDDIQALATASFFQDLDLPRRRTQMQALRASFGRCLAVTAVEAENNLRGRWLMHCEKGRIEVYITMAPTVPPKVQVLQMTAAKPLEAGLREMVTQTAALIGTWDGAQAARIFAPSLDVTLLQPQFEALRVQYGAMTVGDVLESDGETQARVRLNSARGGVDMKVVVDAAAGQVNELSFTRPRETLFVV